jgi:hypothetical protein
MDKQITLIRGWKKDDARYALIQVGEENRLFELQGDAAIESEKAVDSLGDDFIPLTAVECFVFNRKMAFVAHQFPNFKRLFPEAVIHVKPIQRTR